MAAAEGGDPSAADALFAALYAELHGLASRQLARSSGALTLGTTTLLHEAYLSMHRRDAEAFPDRARFMGYAARVMRGLLIDYVRARKAQKRGGEFHIAALPDEVAAGAGEGEEVTQVGRALEQLAALDPDLAQLVDLKFFCGFSFTEIAAMRGVSERTVQRHWDKARILLHGLVAD
ncbi:MAG TPA: ECF-type sigma factor [Vicinamibacteria bacterium]|nr:ECF-type sigma factor [Vicinamibacteria bacterium]